MTQKQMLQSIKSRVVPILKKHDVSRAGIFGSYARGKQNKQSDIDLLVEFKGEKTLIDLAAMELQLEQTIKKKFDVLTYNSINPLLKNIILSEEIKII